MRKSLVLLLGACLGALAGCSADHADLDNREQANFANGDFEAGSFTSWAIVPHQNSAGIGILPPTQISDLTLRDGVGNAANTKIVTGATTESVLAAGLQNGDTLKYPKYGRYSAVVNELGSGYNSNELKQTMTTTSSDIDPADGMIHIRFVLAPVLQNPGHPDKQQPYFYLELRNATRGTLLHSSFNFSNQPGVPYKNSGGGAVQYTDWQLFDVAPGLKNLAVGDSVLLNIIASGCSQSGHWGHLYVDGFGTFIPGLTIAATAPGSAVAGTDITYTFTVRNGSSNPVDNVVTNEVLPAGTTFVSSSGATCSSPPVGGTGTVTCQLGTLGPTSTTTFNITVNINQTATGTVNNGNYNVQGTGVTALIGPLVTTTIIPSYLITVNVPGGNGTISCTSPVQSGTNSVCTITPAVGYGLATFTLDGVDALAGINGNTYTITNVTAPHTITGTFGAVARYNIFTNVSGGNGTLTCQTPVAYGASSVCTITPNTGYALASITLDGMNVMSGVNGNYYTVGNVKADHTVNVSFAPAMYIITTSVLGGNGTLTCTNVLTRGANSVCTITPASGYILSGLYLDGGDVTGQVMGSNYTITNVTASHSVQAVFVRAMFPVTASVTSGNGTLSCQTPVASGASSVCTITPDTGYVLTALTRNGVDVMAGVTNNVYTIGNVTAAQNVQATFAPAMFTITYTVAGGNGTIVCTSPLATGQNSTCTINAAANYGLATLTLDGNSVIDSVSGNTYTITNVTASHLVQATFAQTGFYISSSVPGGNGALDCQSPVLSGASSVCKIIPATGFVLANFTLDGVDAMSGVTNGTYTISNVMASHQVVATFAPAVFTINTSVNGGNGTVTCNSPVNYGSNSTCTITPAPGFVLTSLTLDGKDVSGGLSPTSYTVTNVTANHLVQAGFTRAPYTVTGSVPNGNGTIVCSSPVLYGQTSVCQITPAYGYLLQTLTVDGNNAISQVNGNSISIPNVTSNRSVVGTFVLSTYMITALVPGGNGSITCSGPVSQGGTATCTVVADSGFLLSTLTLDGKDVLSTLNGNTLTINNVTSSHTVQGTFVRTPNVITINIPGGHGTITCSPPVQYGQDSICQIKADPGYRLTSINLDGRTILTQVNGTSFVIPMVTSSHTVDAAFSAIPTYDITVNILGGNGTITCTTPVPEGQNAICMITPAPGYALDMLNLDGLDGRLLVQGNAFSLYNVRATHTLAGSFKLASSKTCQTAADCLSGFCSDGVCCNRACNGQCEACDVSGSVGTCSTVVGAPHVNHPTCGDFMCSESGCMTECSTDVDCVAGAVCSNGACHQGEASLNGGGILGCSTTNHRNSSSAAMFTFLALLAFSTFRRRFVA